jgi:ubiquinone/menaquinone biosynthesis C-methylase UbiE
MRPSSPEQMLEHARAFGLLAARDCGLLPALAAAPARSPGELAENLSLDPLATRLLLDLLTLCEATRPGDAQLAEAEALCRGTSGLEAQVWTHLPRFLRTGATLFEAVGRAGAYAIVTPQLGTMFAADADLLAERLRQEPGSRIADIGAGSGVWSLAMAALDPDAHVTAVDLPAVLPRFRERAESLGLSARISTLAGSYFEVELPHAAFDRLIVANVLHLEPAARAAALLVRLAPALAPGGLLIVCDAFSRGSIEEERARAAYALHLAMRVQGGHPHRHTDIAPWLGQAACTPLDLIDLAPRPAIRAALIARKRG